MSRASLNCKRGGAAVAVGLLLIAASCSSDSKSAADTTAGPTTSAAAATTGTGDTSSTDATGTTGATASSDVTSSTGDTASTDATGDTIPGGEGFLSAVTNKDIDRTGQTIKIGVVNTEGSGTLSLPDFRIGAETAIDYINAHGGVNGGTYKVDECKTDGTPEGSVNCANQLISDGVALVFAGIDSAADASIQQYQDAGVPWVSGNSSGAFQVESNPFAHVLHTSASTAFIAPMQLFVEMGAKKIAYIEYSSAGIKGLVENVILPTAKKLGLEIVEVPIDFANPDYSSVVAAAATANVDGIFGTFSDAACTPFMTAINAAGFTKPVMPGPCSQYVDELGDKAANSYVFSDTYAAASAPFAPQNIQDNFALYTTTMKAAGQDAAIADTFTGITFASMMELTAILNTVPSGTDIKGDSINAAFTVAKTSPGFLGPDLHCGESPYAGSPSVCRGDVLPLVVSATSGGKAELKPASDSGFITVGA